MQTINLPAILIANIMGIVVLFAIAFGSSWQTQKIFSSNTPMKVIFYTCLVSCFADPICFLADGKPGMLCYLLVYGCNMWLYVGNVIISLMWIAILSDKLNARIPPVHRVIIDAGALLCVALLIINLFVPCVFYVDLNNVYHRGELFWPYMVYYVAILLYGLGFYLYERQVGGKLKNFPVWAFVVPAMIGMAIQFILYGVSTITPFLTVSLVCMFISFQNEYIYRDKLTGLYNRFYLEIFEKVFKKSKDPQYTIMMLDLNGFKKINDTYGHSVGDQALMNAAGVLETAVGDRGQVIRYAGDEFIVILHTKDDDSIKDTIARIHQSMAGVSEGLPYELSVSLGYSNISAGEFRMDEILLRIDKLMYEEKLEYYKAQPQHGRSDRAMQGDNE